ncbi:glycoside hydrolase 43 family protein [Sphaerisporangium melleum]|uniref:Glycoside hydrolase 43 family protein n=1 Tax=Sphaerisporangium melleum TaxID=321316 RepID=A0A917VKE7_9ACTN|nr:glycoside hydrolase family 43 protein [Sphaerisporangium melleum]GGK90226.1 glycoside hydrolase 43 family protein [Sphaerisporangium melleum]GII72889.1 glycoside hydrolase 43 family protein [Sphaerisporangium melleum]
MRFTNPILPGFHPDPSICRVGEDYYLVTSSFEWFPGVPIFHSKDLVHWRQIGHVLDRASQLPLDGVRPSGGIYAPTLRHHNGLFYMITTLIDGLMESGNFIVTATDPAGPWSEPYWLPETEGFDPSLFFDDDGRAWVHGTRPARQQQYEGHTEIWLRELDLDGVKLVGEEHVLWDGAVKGAVWAEGPHIYKVDGRYHLLVSEGGTAHDHAISVARADHVTGPYTGSSRNPILTHRNLGRDHPIVGTGHGDLVQTPAGDWWMVLLAMRPYGGYHYNLGRETFLTRVHWEDGWPVAEPVRPEGEAPDLPACRWPAPPACDNFDTLRLLPQWNHLRTPREPYWTLTERPGFLRLRGRPESITERANPTLIARRQEHVHFAVHTAMEFVPEGRERAGLALVQNDDFHILLVMTASGLTVIRRENGVDHTLVQADVAPGRLWLGVEAHGQEYQMLYGIRPGEWRKLGEPVDGRVLSTTMAGGFIGAYIGVYLSGEGDPTGNVADFDWFEYLPLPEH